MQIQDVRWAKCSQSLKRLAHTPLLLVCLWKCLLWAACSKSVCPKENTLSFRETCENTRLVVFWMGTVCSGKLSVGQVIWAWKMKRNPAKCFTVLLTRCCSSGSTYLPSELQQSPTYLCRGSFCLSLISGDYFIWLHSWFRRAVCVPAAPIPPCSLPTVGPSLPHPRLGLESSFPIPCCTLEKSLFHKLFFHGICWLGKSGWAVQPNSLWQECIALPLHSRGAAHKGSPCPLSELINTACSGLLKSSAFSFQLFGHKSWALWFQEKLFRSCVGNC